MRYKNFFSFVAFAVVSVCLFSCSSTSKKEDNSAASKAEEDEVPVICQNVKYYDFVDKAKIWGEAKPIKTVGAYSKIVGIVKSKNIEEGEIVEKGKLLAEIEQDLPGLKYETHKVYAPISGIVLKANFFANDRVNNQQPIAILAPIDSIYFVAKIYDDFYKKLSLGQLIEIEFLSLKGEKFVGKLKEFATMMEPQANYIEAKFIARNNNKKIKFGFNGSAEIALEKRKNPGIPVDALIKTGAQTYIFKVENNAAKRVLVKTGLINGNITEIIGNILENDKVVVFGQNKLAEGSKVKIVEVQK